MKLILQVIKALFRKIEASRTHWEEVEEVEILTETTVTISEDNSDADLPKTTQLTVGQTYFVILDGVSYECVAWYSNNDSDAVIIGNGAIFGGEGGNSEPFSCDSYSSGEIYLNTEKAGTYTISISTKKNIIHKLDKKYLPDEVIESIGIANNAQTMANNAQTTANNAQTAANNAQTAANNAQTVANNAQTTANSKMNANNPVGTGSFSMGRKTNSVVGNYSHAEGYNTTASSYGSHAEGSSTIASGKYSHAEGDNTAASGDYSHAEGANNIASGYSSHAEGSSTTASGSRSHAEGVNTTAKGESSHAEGDNTTASAKDSHAEGFNTTASGENSHAEGYYTSASAKDSHAEGFFTTAKSSYQHVQGICNIADSSNKYAHIVGNGRNISNRSNAHTLDWNGNAWYAGDIYTGSTSGVNKDEGSKKLATEEYVDASVVTDEHINELIDAKLIISSSTAGSTKKFKITVDDNGVISATEVS